MTKLVREVELQPCITERLPAQHSPAHVSGKSCSLPQNLSTFFVCPFSGVVHVGLDFFFHRRNCLLYNISKKRGVVVVRILMVIPVVIP